MELLNYITESINALDLINPEASGRAEFNIPVTHICGIKIWSFWVAKRKIYRHDKPIEIEYKVCIIGEIRHINEDRDGCMIGLYNESFDTLEDALEAVDKLLTDGEFTPNCRIKIKDDKGPPFTHFKAFAARHKNNENIKLFYDDCIVCGDLTKTHTDCCEKKLCLKCLQGVERTANEAQEKEDRDYEGGAPIACPNCRAAFNFTGHIGMEM